MASDTPNPDSVTYRAMHLGEVLSAVIDQVLTAFLEPGYGRGKVVVACAQVNEV